MLKKFLLCSALFILTGSLTAGAQTLSVQKELASDKYTVWGQADGTEYRKTVSVMITKKEAPEIPVYVSTAEADSWGEYSYSFYMPDNADDGEYSVAVRSYDAAGATPGSLYYSKAETKTECLRILNEKTTSGDFALYLSEKAMDLGLRNRASVKLFASQLNAVYGKVFEKKPAGGYTLDGLYNTYYEELSVAAVNAADTTNISTLINDYKDYFKFEQEICSTLFSGISDQAYVFNKFIQRDYTDMADVRKAFNENTLLSAIKFVSSPGQVTEYISNYSTVIPFNMTYYNASNSAKQAMALAGKEFADMAALEAAILAEYTLEQQGAASVGGGGGSGNTSSVVSLVGSTGSTSDLPTVFSDIRSGYWAADAISYLSSNGIVSGYTDGTFNPGGYIKREEFAVMLCKAFGFTGDVFAQFSDVPATHWASRYIAAAKENGITSGMGDGSFGIGRNITREDMAVMIYGAVKASGISLTEINSAKDFSDGGSIAEYAQESVGILQRAGIVNGMGDGSFNPKGNTTRAEASQIIYNVINGGV